MDREKLRMAFWDSEGVEGPNRTCRVMASAPLPVPVPRALPDHDAPAPLCFACIKSLLLLLFSRVPLLPPSPSPPYSTPRGRRPHFSCRLPTKMAGGGTLFILRPYGRRGRGFPSDFVS